MMESKLEQASVLWNRFLMLTQEMKKFIDQDDVDMFLSLLEQRISLQKQIEELGTTGFEQSEAGQVLGEKITTLCADIQYQAQVWLNKAKGQERKVNAYGSLGYGDNRSGFNFNVYK